MLNADFKLHLIPRNIEYWRILIFLFLIYFTVIVLQTKYTRLNVWYIKLLSTQHRALWISMMCGSSGFHRKLILLLVRMWDPLRFSSRVIYLAVIRIPTCAHPKCICFDHLLTCRGQPLTSNEEANVHLMDKRSFSRKKTADAYGVSEGLV